MPDIQQFQIIPLANASVNVPRFQLSGKVVDEHDGTVLFDFTGANAITFPNDLIGKLTAAERQQFVALIQMFLVERISKKFG